MHLKGATLYEILNSKNKNNETFNFKKADVDSGAIDQLTRICS